jgi:hypothetical protein
MTSVNSINPTAFTSLSLALQPQKDAALRLGSNIVPRNPDLEVAALTLKDIPLTANKFRDMSNGQDWYRFSFTVLGVGPPGFSTVPYSSTRKKDEKPAPGLCLYEDAGGNTAKMYSYKKGKTNKDRGERVENVPHQEASGDAADGTLSVTAVLRPGMHLAHFLRTDDFAVSSKFFVNDAAELDEREVLPAFSVVYLQVSSANVEQAEKGRLLKIKRLKLAANSSELLHACIKRLPSSEEEFQKVNKCSEEENWAIRENMDKGNTRVFPFTPDGLAFATDEDESVLVLSQETDPPDMLITEQAIQSLLPRATRVECLKLLNIALACNAVRMLVRTNVSQGMVMDCGGDSFTHRVVAVFLDVNVLLSLELANSKLENIEQWNTEVAVASSPLQMRVHNNALYWTDTRNKVPLRAQEFQIGFRMPIEALVGENNGNAEDTEPDAARFLDKGFNSHFLPVNVILLQGVEPAQIEAAHSVMALELRPKRQQAGKRKRMNLAEV